MSTWEYRTERVRADSAGIDSLAPMLNDLGAVGWEVVGFAAAGVADADALVVVLKRPSLPPVPPNDRAPDWKLDPLGRHELRYWDGLRWTEHVSDESRTSTDPPLLE
jgi:hypothetical protein